MDHYVEATEMDRIDPSTCEPYMVNDSGGVILEPLKRVQLTVDGSHP